MSLPPRYARKYNSAYLKAKIADENMWSLIPGVEPDICGLDGARRMKQNELLFEFMPNMRSNLIWQTAGSSCFQIIQAIRGWACAYLTIYPAFWRCATCGIRWNTWGRYQEDRHTAHHSV